MQRGANVVELPVFEGYGERIEDWLARLGAPQAGGSVSRIAGAIRRTAAEVERVRQSPRHASLAELLWRAANALDDAERDGARYLLMMALALLSGSAAGAQAKPAVTQLPVVDDAITGMAAG